MRVNLTPSVGLSIGDILPISITFLTAAGAPATVTAGQVTIRVRAGAATATTIATGDITVASGVATFDHLCAAQGMHQVHAEWTDGTEGAAVDGYFMVEPDLTV